MQGLDVLVDAAGRKEAEDGEDSDLFSESDENEDNESEVAEVELEVSSTKPAQRRLEVDEGEYQGSPSKRVESKKTSHQANDNDKNGDEDEEDSLRTSARLLRTAVSQFKMPEVGARVAITYPAGEYHATIFKPEGWKAGEVVLAFDDGDHHSFTKGDLKRCAESGHYKVVTPEHPLHGKGCVEGKEAPVAADIQVANLRGANKKVEGVWLGRRGIVGKEKLSGYESFVAADRSRAEFRTLMYGSIVTFGAKEELGVLVRAAKCPMDTTAVAKTRFFVVVTPLAEALAGLLPAITRKFQLSPTAWQVSPFTKTHCVPSTDSADSLPPFEVAEISDQLTTVTIGDASYFRLSPDSPLYEQLEKVASDDLLEDTLLRSKLQTQQKRTRVDSTAPASEVSSLPESHTTPQPSRGGDRALGSWGRGFGSGSASSSLGEASTGLGAAAAAPEAVMVEQEREALRRQVREMHQQMNHMQQQQLLQTQQSLQQSTIPTQQQVPGLQSNQQQQQPIYRTTAAAITAEHRHAEHILIHAAATHAHAVIAHQWHV